MGHGQFKTYEVGALRARASIVHTLLIVAVKYYPPSTSTRQVQLCGRCLVHLPTATLRVPMKKRKKYLLGRHDDGRCRRGSSSFAGQRWRRPPAAFTAYTIHKIQNQAELSQAEHYAVATECILPPLLPGVQRVSTSTVPYHHRSSRTAVTSASPHLGSHPK